ncbi:MAG: PIN domain-containing protein [Clostridiales bacterium]|nr:PIN domain-containing protein [Clostridiales bacterium]
MNVLIDTNVILDVLLRRAPFYEDSARIITLSEKGKLHGFVSASAITDIFYITKKELKSKSSATELLTDLLQTISVASVSGDSIYEALELQWDDFEDSLQYVVGRNILAEYIVTRNTKDFVGGTIKAFNPEDFLNKMATSP